MRLFVSAVATIAAPNNLPPNDTVTLAVRLAPSIAMMRVAVAAGTRRVVPPTLPVSAGGLCLALRFGH